jgi:hypothetical protein
METRIKRHYETRDQYWQKQIADWKVSGLSQKQFCLSRSLALSTFCYWKSKINRIKPITPKFYPLTVPVLASTSSDTGLILLVGSKQFQIQIKKDFSQTTLKKLVATLEEL